MTIEDSIDMQRRMQEEQAENLNKQASSLKSITQDIPRFTIALQDINKKRGAAIKLYETSIEKDGALETLRWCTRNEKRVFDVLLPGIENAENTIKTCKEVMNSNSWGYQISQSHEYFVILDTIAELEFVMRFTRKELKKMEERRELEERFLSSKDVKHFNAFVEMWRKEAMTSEDIVKKLATQKHRNDIKGLALISGSIHGLVIGSVAGLQTQNLLIGAIGAVFGALIGYVGALYAFFNTDKNDEDYELKELKKVGISFGFFGGLKQKTNSA